MTHLLILTVRTIKALPLPSSIMSNRAGPWGTRVAAAAVAIGLAVLAAGCTIGPSHRPPLATSGAFATTGTGPTTVATTMPTGPGGPGRAANPIAWAPCPDSVARTAPDGTVYAVDCAEVEVPLDYGSPESATIALAVSRALASGVGPAAPPLVLLPGDPGQWSHESIVSLAAALPARITTHFAVLTVDPRGTGSSMPLTCLEPSTVSAILGLSVDPSSARGAGQMASITRRVTFDCGDAAGPSLTKFNSTFAADDLDTLRAALGVRTISVIGRGSGATIGAVYAHRYPGRIQAMVLDSPLDPLAAPSAQAINAAVAAEALLADFAAACPQFDGGCPLGGDVRAAVSAVVTRLADGGYRTGDDVVTGGSILLAMVHLLPQRDQWPSLATAIAAIVDGDGAPLRALLVRAMGGPRMTAILTGRILYRCNDTAERLGGAALRDAVAAARAKAPLFGPFTVALADLCNAWPAPDVALTRISGAGAGPIMIVGSVNNPLHPYAGARAVTMQLSSAVLVSWQSGVDGAYPGNDCVATVVDTYLLEGAMPALGALCPP